MIRTPFVARPAFGMTLGLALAVTLGAGATPAMAKDKPKGEEAPKLAPTKAFIPVYTAAANAITAASTRADVVAAKKQVSDAENAYSAATTTAARTAAKSARETALAGLATALSGERAKVETAFTTAANADDKMLAGQLALNLGNVANDKLLQRRGLQAMVDSGKLSQANLAKYNFFIGGLSFDSKDYATARTALAAAIAAGYTENDVRMLLAEAYIGDNQNAVGLAKLQEAVAAHAAPAPEDWLRRGVVVAYKAKLVDQAGAFSGELVSAYPTTENWSLAIAVLRDTARYPLQETLDLMRLMDRTASYSEPRDYFEYIQAADPRRLPGEVLRVINGGIAAGKLQASDIAVSDPRNQASGRIAADKASLPAVEREARAANANAASVMAAGDAFLSYGNSAKAIEMFTLALTKPGVDAARALTRLGIAQTDLGDIAAAKATFAKVEGPRKAMAALWSAYASTKAAPAPATK